MTTRITVDLTPKQYEDLWQLAHYRYDTYAGVIRKLITNEARRIRTEKEENISK